MRSAISNRRILAAFIVGALLVASSVLAFERPWLGQTNADSAAWKLTVIGPDGEGKSLTMNQVRAIPPVTGKGGFFTTAGVINGPYAVKGAAITDLCGLVGGITPSDAVMISAADGYSSIFGYDQVTGNFVTYDGTLKEVPHSALKLVLMYEQDGKPLSQDGGKPMRMAIVGGDGLLTEGNMWVKWVNKVQVIRLH